MARTSLFALLAFSVISLGTAQAGWRHHHYHYGYPAYAAYPMAAAYYPMAPAYQVPAYQLPVAPQVNVDEAQLARLLEQSLGAARTHNLAAAAANGPSPEMIQVQQDLAGLKAQFNNLEAKVDEHDAQIRSIQEELRAIKAQMMK